MIQFQYFDGCPNAKSSLNNLLAIKQELDLSDNLIEVAIIPDLEISNKTNFQGSPTIIINGIDIFTGLPPEGNNYSCRIYTFEGEKTGIIPKAFIREKILAHIKSDINQNTR